MFLNFAGDVTQFSESWKIKLWRHIYRGVSCWSKQDNKQISFADAVITSPQEKRVKS